LLAAKALLQDIRAAKKQLNKDFKAMERNPCTDITFAAE
jgi:hypothetical protein